MNAKLFINYRRDDTAPYAGRLYDRLSLRFGEDQVFIDIDQIEPGEDFVEVINRKVGTCDIAIVAIGPNWLHATDASGKRRLDDEEDFVRMEIVAALQRKIRVIPVLVGGARMPGRHDLPEALAPLSRRNAIELSETRFHADVNRLIEAIEKSVAVAEQKAEAEATRLAEEGRQAAQLAELKLAEEKKAAEAEAARLADEKRKREEAARAAGEKRKAADAAERARVANEQRRRRDRPHSESERSQQDSVATAKDSTTPVESTQRTPAIPPVASIFAAVKKPQVWTRKRLIMVSAIGTIVILLLALAGFLRGPDLFRNADSRKVTDVQKKADQGDALSMWILGESYHFGVYGLSRDLPKAAELFQKAADQGEDAGLNSLGELYEKGEGVPKDLHKARELYQKAADHGSEPAIANLKRLDESQ